MDNNKKKVRQKMKCSALFNIDKELYKKAYLEECKIVCDCGTKVNRFNIETHKLTYKHKFKILQKEMEKTKENIEEK